VDSCGGYSQTGDGFGDVIGETRGPTDVDVTVANARGQFVQSGAIERRSLTWPEDGVEGSLALLDERTDLVGMH
jgi:hypothetical protein